LASSYGSITRRGEAKKGGKERKKKRKKQKANGLASPLSVG